MYTVPTIADFHARFDAGEPAFVGLSDAVIAYWLADSANYLNAPRWDVWYSDGLLNLAAHEIVMQLWQASKGGGVAVAHEYESKSIGGISAARGQGLAREAADRFQRSTYGQRYAQLRRLVGAGALITGDTTGIAIP